MKPKQAVSRTWSNLAGREDERKQREEEDEKRKGRRGREKRMKKRRGEVMKIKWNLSRESKRTRTEDEVWRKHGGRAERDTKEWRRRKYAQESVI